MTLNLQDRNHIEEVLEAFGAWIEVEELPVWIEKRPRFQAFGSGLEMRENSYCIKVVGWQSVPGWFLVWIDDHRADVIRLWGLKP